MEKVTNVGRVILYHGDARAVLPTLNQRVHLTVTSPPYNVGIDYSEHDDAIPYEEYLALLGDVFAGVRRITVEGGRLAVVVPFGVGRNPWKPLSSDVMGVLQDVGWTLRGQIIWDKGTSGSRTSWGSYRLPSDPSLRDTCEAVLVAHNGRSKLEVPIELKRRDTKGTHTEFLADGRLFMELAQDHWTVSPESASRIGHPAPFPLELVERLIRFYGYPGARLLDPFAGSGTVGVVATRLGCPASLIEIDASYFKLATKRVTDA